MRLKIINQMALNYSNAGQDKIAIDIYYQLLKYMKKHIMSLSESSKLVILITYNYSRSLYLEKRYRDAIEIANQGLEVSIQSRYAGYIGGCCLSLDTPFMKKG